MCVCVGAYEESGTYYNLNLKTIYRVTYVHAYAIRSIPFYFSFPLLLLLLPLPPLLFYFHSPIAHDRHAPPLVRLMGHGHRCSTLANLFLHTVHTFPDSLAPPSFRLYKALRAIFDSHRRSLFFTQRASLTSTKNISRTETRSTTFTNRREIDKRILVGFNKFLHAYSVQVLHVVSSFLPTFFRISYVELSFI